MATYQMRLAEWTAAQKMRAAAILAAVVATMVAYGPAIGNLWARWAAQQELSHSYFIPLISAWLIWRNRGAVRQSVGGPSRVGVFLVMLAIFGLFVGKLTSIFVIQQISLVAAIGGLVAAFGGVSLLRATAAPIAFLLFAVPPPFWVLTVLSWKFQGWSSVLGAALTRLFGVPVLLEGNVIDLGDSQLMVAEACSGLRYLFPFVSLGMMAAYVFRGPLWQKAAIVLATIPITIIMNSVRIAFTAVMVHYYGLDQAKGFTHFFEGWVVFLLCLAALYAVIALFARFTTPKMSAADMLAQPELREIAPTAPSTNMLVGATAIVATAVIFLAGSKLLNAGTLTAPPKRAFAEVTSEFAGWRAEVRPIDPSIADVLRADDAIVLDLASPQGENFNLYMAYLTSQRDGRSWHSPRQCIPGGGWQIDSQTYQTSKLNTGATIHFNRLVIAQGSSRQLVYYWYDQRGRKVANEFVMKFWLTVDSVTKRRTDGAMVRLITPINADESVEKADARLHRFMERVNEILPAYVPA